MCECHRQGSPLEDRTRAHGPRKLSPNHTPHRVCASIEYSGRTKHAGQGSADVLSTSGSAKGTALVVAKSPPGNPGIKWNGRGRTVAQRLGKILQVVPTTGFSTWSTERHRCDDSSVRPRFSRCSVHRSNRVSVRRCRKCFCHTAGSPPLRALRRHPHGRL